MGHSDIISRLSAAVNGECSSPFEKALCPLSPDLPQDSGWEHLHYFVPGCKPVFVQPWEHLLGEFVPPGDLL